MSAEEVQSWLEESVQYFASQLNQATGLRPELALRRAESILLEAVPDGGDTPGHSFRWIATGSDRVGKVWFGPRGNREAVTHIWDIGVDPAHQGHGYGGNAIDLVADEAGRSGSASLTLNVFEFNPDAKRLYERKGFVSGAAIDGHIPMTRSLI